jgi:hypothetical protein
MSRPVNVRTAPAADASRVAAIRNSLDLKDAEALPVFGERARLEVAASVERLLAEVRSGDLVEAVEFLRRAGELIAAQDPTRLTPRGPIALFDPPRRRLARFRVHFQALSATIDTLAVDIAERAARMARRAEVLDRLHAQARTFILELDAYLQAGGAALAAAPTASDNEALEAFHARLGVLAEVRDTAVEQLSLVRTIQNVDAPLAEGLTRAAARLQVWRADWTELLGLTPARRGRRIRPDQVGLYETKAQALESLVLPTAGLAEAKARRQAAEARMEQAARFLAKPSRR